MNVLFVCTLNKARSVTAEHLFRRVPGLSVRSAGTSKRAAHQVDENDLAWADLVVVFEAEHERWLRDTFDGELPRIVDVGVPDEYRQDEPRLLAELVEALEPLLGRPGQIALAVAKEAAKAKKAAKNSYSRSQDCITS